MKKVILIVMTLLMIIIPNTVIMAQDSSEGNGDAVFTFTVDDIKDEPDEGPPVNIIEPNTPEQTVTTPPTVGQGQPPVQQQVVNEEEVLEEVVDDEIVDVLGDNDKLLDRVIYMLQKDNVYSISLITLLIILLVLLIISYIINKKQDLEEVFSL